MRTGTGFRRKNFCSPSFQYQCNAVSTAFGARDCYRWENFLGLSFAQCTQTEIPVGTFDVTQRREKIRHQRQPPKNDLPQRYSCDLPSPFLTVKAGPSLLRYLVVYKTFWRIKKRSWVHSWNLKFGMVKRWITLWFLLWRVRQRWLLIEIE